MESKQNKGSKSTSQLKADTTAKVSHPLKSAVKKVQDKVKNVDGDGLIARGVKAVENKMKKVDVEGIVDKGAEVIKAKVKKMDGEKMLEKGIKKAEKKLKKADGNAKKIIGAVAAGVAIGTAVGMHITPDKVEKTKNNIKKRVQSLASDLSKKMDGLSAAIGDKI